MKDGITFFGETTFRNQRKRFGIKTDDRRRHVYLIGKTGMGKTAMMENMAVQDIQQGNGIGFIDPHGEAAEKLLDFVPQNRINDVIYFNPADLDFPVAFNVMEKVETSHRHLIAAGLLGVFKKIWPDVWSARMEYILNNCVLALLEYPGSTLLGVNRMLSDPDYRKKVVERITDPMIKSFWLNEFARYTQRYEVEATAAIQNKIGQFISAPLIRNIIGQVRSAINMRKAMDEGKILIANISKGRIGEDSSRLLGALLITKLYLAAMSRVDTPEEKRRDFYLYVDEFQNFATKAFVNILSEARKYRLALILGNQYISQLEEMTPTGKSSEVRDAIFGNVGTMVCFRVGAEDAEFLEREFLPEFALQDLVNLAKYNIYLKLMINGLAGRPFSAETLLPLPKPKESNREKIIKASQERYTTPKEIVEEKISRWAEVLKPSAERPFRPAPSVLYDAQCASCGKWTKVIFPPDGTRPVYCKPCLRERQRRVEMNEVHRLRKTEQGEERRLSSSPFAGAREGEERRLSSSPFAGAREEKETKKISLEEVSKTEPVSFSSSKRAAEVKEKPKRKEVNVEELKKVLEKSLKKTK